MKEFFKHKFRKKSPIEIVGIILFGGLFIAGLAVLFGFGIMWLWNTLMPELFGLKTLTFWQAVGLFILLKILLGGCGGGMGKSKSNSSNDACENESKTDFSKWKHYDKFWEEEGNELYEEFVKRQVPNNPVRKSDLSE